MYFVYVLQSETSGKYYVGMTDDVNRRLVEHNSGKTTSTRKCRPWKVVHTESFDDRQSAWKRERQIKSYKGGEAFKRLVHGGVA